MKSLLLPHDAGAYECADCEPDRNIFCFEHFHCHECLKAETGICHEHRPIGKDKDITITYEVHPWATRSPEEMDRS
jgi:hypothetical protein